VPVPVPAHTLLAGAAAAPAATAAAAPGGFYSVARAPVSGSGYGSSGTARGGDESALGPVDKRRKDVKVVTKADAKAEAKAAHKAAKAAAKATIKSKGSHKRSSGGGSDSDSGSGDDGSSSLHHNAQKQGGKSRPPTLAYTGSDGYSGLSGGYSGGLGGGNMTPTASALARRAERFAEHLPSPPQSKYPPRGHGHGHGHARTSGTGGGGGGTPGSSTVLNRAFSWETLSTGGALSGMLAGAAAATAAGDGGTGDDDDVGALKIVGTSTQLEKKYLRLTSLPDPATVRPVPVLLRAFAHVCARWARDRDYKYACEQLKTVRQDLSIQHERTPFAVRVYEAHARVALEVGDLSEYNQCQTQIAHLYEHDAALAANAVEFTCYRLLYNVVTQDKGGFTGALRRLSPAELRHPAVEYCLAVARAVSLCDYTAFFDLFTRGLYSSVLALLPAAACAAAPAPAQVLALVPVPTYAHQPFLVVCFTSKLIVHMRFTAMQRLLAGARPAPLAAAHAARVLRFGTVVTPSDAALLDAAASAAAAASTTVGTTGAAGANAMAGGGKKKAIVTGKHKGGSGYAHAHVHADEGVRVRVSVTVGDLNYTGHWGWEAASTATKAGKAAGKSTDKSIDKPTDKAAGAVDVAEVWDGLVHASYGPARAETAPPESARSDESAPPAGIAIAAEFVRLRGGAVAASAAAGDSAAGAPVWPPRRWDADGLAAAVRGLQFVTVGAAGVLSRPDPATVPGADDAVRAAMERGITHAHIGLAEV
jgi:hypothetical protein